MVNPKNDIKFNVEPEYKRKPDVIEDVGIYLYDKDGNRVEYKQRDWTQPSSEENYRYNRHKWLLRITVVVVVACLSFFGIELYFSLR